MTPFLFEQPWLIGTIGAILSIATFYGWTQSGSPLVLRTACGMVAFTLVLLLINVLVVTQSEEIRAWASEAAHELENNQRDKVMERIHPDCTARVDQCVQRMNGIVFSAFRVSKIHGVDVVRENGIVKAKLRMNVVVQGNVEGYYREMKGRVVRWVNLTLERFDGRWYVMDIEDREPQHEFVWS